MRIQPLRNTVMFEFLDEISYDKGKLRDRKTPGGIILPTLDSGQKLPRWGRVLAVGPEAQVAEGEYILIEGLAWMEGCNPKFLDGRRMWKTDDTRIIVATDDPETVTLTEPTVPMA